MEWLLVLNEIWLRSARLGRGGGVEAFVVLLGFVAKCRPGKTVVVFWMRRQLSEGGVGFRTAMSTSKNRYGM